MKEIQILTALGEVKERYIEEADMQEKVGVRRQWIGWAIAACMTLLLAGGMFFRIIQSGDARELPPIGSQNPPIGTGTEDNMFYQEYFEECSIANIRSMYGLPSQLGQDDAGEHYVNVGADSVYDYSTASAEADMEVLEYAPNPYGGIYVLQKGGSYTPVISCNVEGNGEAKLKLQGEERPQGTIDVGEHVVFPQSGVMLISGSTAGTQMTRVSSGVWGGEPPTIGDLYGFLSLVERADVVEPDQAMNPNRRMVGCDMLIVLVDDAGSQIGIALKAFDDGFAAMQVWYENEIYREREALVFLKSEELIGRMKELTHWRVIDFSELDMVCGISCPHEKRDALNEEEREKLLGAIRRSTREYVDTACPYNTELWFLLENGEVIRALWCNDSCGYLAVEGGVYRLSEEDAQYLTEIFAR